MSIKSESESEMQRLMSERLVREEFGTEFLKLFNTHCVDFVKRLPDGTYVPVEWPRQATHKLVATRWNNPEDFPVNAHGKRVVPDYLALSVCAVPLHRKRVLRGPAIKIRAPLPRIHPEYYGHGGVNGKRKVVFWMVKAMHARVKKTFVKRATEAQLDLLYRNLRKLTFGTNRNHNHTRSLMDEKMTIAVSVSILQVCHRFLDCYGSIRGEIEFTTNPRSAFYDVSELMVMRLQVVQKFYPEARLVSRTKALQLGKHNVR